MADKQRVDIEILGQKYPIRSEAPPEYVRQLASFVDQRAREIRGDAPGQVRDVAVSQANQVRGREPADLLVVGDDTMAPQALMVVAVDEDQPLALTLQAAQQVAVLLRVGELLLLLPPRLHQLRVGIDGRLGRIHARFGHDDEFPGWRIVGIARRYVWRSRHAVTRL